MIDYTSGDSGSSTSGGGGSGLSGGVIAGIAVVGALLLASLVLLLVGWLLQRKARRGPNELTGRSEEGELKRGPSVGLRWANISLHIPIRQSPWSPLFDGKKQSSSSLSTTNSADRPGYKTILTGVSGSVAAGNMLAILGPSGAGKTSLVDILSGQDKRGAVSGQVSFFVPGDKDDIDSIERMPRIGYVDQVCHSSRVPECHHRLF